MQNNSPLLPPGVGREKKRERSGRWTQLPRSENIPSSRCARSPPCQGRSATTQKAPNVPRTAYKHLKQQAEWRKMRQASLQSETLQPVVQISARKSGVSKTIGRRAQGRLRTLARWGLLSSGPPSLTSPRPMIRSKGEERRVSECWLSAVRAQFCGSCETRTSSPTRLSPENRDALGKVLEWKNSAPV